MEATMKTFFAGLLGFVAVYALTVAATKICRAGTPETANAALEAMPRDLEMKFALSALPPQLRDQASVYVLNPGKGYVSVRTGTNGFTCIVERTEWMREDFRNDIYTPLCYDAEGTKNQLKVYMDVAELRAKGMSAAKIKMEIERRFKDNIYKAPARAGLSYMVAPIMRTYPSPLPTDKMVVTMSMPHIMYYAPGLSAGDIGATRPPSPYPFILEQGPQGYMIQLIGETESARILSDNKDLVSELCSYKNILCLNAPPAGHAH
jgi:hypothetical protein